MSLMNKRIETPYKNFQKHLQRGAPLSIPNQSATEDCIAIKIGGEMRAMPLLLPSLGK